MSIPTLPQQTSPAELAERNRAIAWAQTLYQWAHSHTYSYEGKTLVLAPIAVLEVDDAHPLPEGQNLNVVQILEILDVGLSLLSNAIINVTNLVNAGAVQFDPPPPASFGQPAPAAGGMIAAFRAKVDEVVEEVGHVIQDVEKAAHALSDAEKLAKLLHEHQGELEALGRDIHKALAKGSATPKESASFSAKLGDILKRIIETVLEAGLADAGLFGRPKAMTDYAAQFQAIVVPNVSSVSITDAFFARSRIAGPNPLLIQKVNALPNHFPVDSARFEALTGASLDAALSSDRVYLVDYRALDGMIGGTYPAGQKYISPGFALFALDEGRKTLRPVAIQCGQTPGHSTPVFYRDDGESWELAKIHLQSADGNYHELISHLGLTHLLVEPFVVATHRNLSPNHPLFVLLLPHFQGTLFINQSAITSLIQPGGNVDRLLAGTIESDWATVANALGALDFNAHMLPNDLEKRGVANRETFPEYPYRDDAVLLWSAIERWVGDYLAVYYNDDAAIVTDMELQAWYQDLVSKDGGCVNGLGETGPRGEMGLFTYKYLVNVVTMVIFTGSVQHATVNFPQHEIMSYTPAMPLAAYAPAPTRVSGPISPKTALAEMPPLEMSFVQLVVGQLLGGVYFTRLGQYDRHQTKPYFQDPRVKPLLDAFQANLREIERIIGTRNIERPCYEFLLPSRIPQSINI